MTLDDAAWKETADRVSTGIRTFLASDVFAEVRGIEADRWLELETLRRGNPQKWQRHSCFRPSWGQIWGCLQMKQIVKAMRDVLTRWACLPPAPAAGYPPGPRLARSWFTPSPVSE